MLTRMSTKVSTYEFSAHNLSLSQQLCNDIIVLHSGDEDNIVGNVSVVAGLSGPMYILTKFSGELKVSIGDMFEETVIFSEPTMITVIPADVNYGKEYLVFTTNIGFIN
jgi:hypothetical protein